MPRSKLAQQIIATIDTMDQLAKLALKAKGEWQELLKRLEKEDKGGKE